MFALSLHPTARHMHMHLPITHGLESTYVCVTAGLLVSVFVYFVITSVCRIINLYVCFLHLHYPDLQWPNKRQKRNV